MIQYSSPTFLFRHECPSNLLNIMKQLKKIGFEGLELYGLFGFTGDQIADFVKQSALKIVCDHIHFDEFTQNTEKAVAERKKTGAEYLTVDNIPENMLPGTKRFSETLKEIERISKYCKKHSIKLLYHNHGYDLIRKVNGVPHLDIILDNTDPELLGFQPDLGWLQLGGGDPEKYLDKYGDRCDIIHIKDFYCSAPTVLESPFLLGTNRGNKDYNFFEFRPAGYGVMNYPALMPKILACNPKWITTDHDMSYERDTYEDMKSGLDFCRFLERINSHE